jgi:hypothetical protein
VGSADTDGEDRRGGVAAATGSSLSPATIAVERCTKDARRKSSEVVEDDARAALRELGTSVTMASDWWLVIGALEESMGTRRGPVRGRSKVATVTM